MFTTCSCQSDVFSSVGLPHAVTGWDSSAESGPLWPHTDGEATPCPPRDLGVTKVGGSSKACEIQVLGAASPPNLVSLERKGDTKDREEFNTSKLSLKILWGFWKNPTWCSGELIAKNGNQTKHSTGTAVGRTTLHRQHSKQRTSLTKKRSLCFSCFFTSTLGCRTRKNIYKVFEWGHSGKDSFPRRNPLPFLMLDLHRISSPC